MTHNTHEPLGVSVGGSCGVRIKVVCDKKSVIDIYSDTIDL